MSRKRGNTFWTVPVWDNSAQVNGPGIGSDAAGNVILSLLDAADFEDRPVYVKRIIGQYNHVTSASIMANALIHHRIMVANTDLLTGNVDAGTLDTILGAERAFLWHEVGFLPTTVGGSFWAPMGSATSDRTVFQRQGAFDISVGRKIHGTDSLIWQSFAKPVAAAGDYSVLIWMRILLEEVD